MQTFDRHKSVEEARLKTDRQNDLRDYIFQETEDALSARAPQEILWNECLRLYEGVPRIPFRDSPIENAPNFEIPLAAISADSIYAQAIDTLFQYNPIVTARATSNTHVEISKHVQRFIDHTVANVINLRPAAEEAILDDVQLGTGVYYTPWTETFRKTKTAKTQARGPRIYSVAPEDFIVRGGADSDLQATPWCGMRTMMTDADLAIRKRFDDWTIDDFTPVGGMGYVRNQRERLGRTTSSRKISIMYEVYRLYVSYDIDNDGIEEDLLVIYDRTSRAIGKILFNPFDRRPFEAMRYQLRPHLFYGIGVVEMLRGFQEETTEVHVHRLLNMMIANCRIWAAREGTVQDVTRLWPNKVVPMGNPREDLIPLQMGDIYPSIALAEASGIALAERRVGMNEMALPRPSQVLGSRTPGITALSLLQQVNRRFTPAFDGIRIATSAAVRQCMYRYQERLLAGDMALEAYIEKILDPGQARGVIQLMKDPDFDLAVAIELTAANASVNRDVDRQNMLQLIQILANYYDRCLQLTMIAANPQASKPVQETALKIVGSLGEIIERTLRSFDNMRDSGRFIIAVEEQLDQVQGLSAEGLAGLGSIFQNIRAVEAANAQSQGMLPGG